MNVKPEGKKVTERCPFNKGVHRFNHLQVIQGSTFPRTGGLSDIGREKSRIVQACECGKVIVSNV